VQLAVVLVVGGAKVELVRAALAERDGVERREAALRI
jgi:hypothetical protein